jgi:very-short-patch-repair endonuclease
MSPAIRTVEAAPSSPLPEREGLGWVGERSEAVLSSPHATPHRSGADRRARELLNNPTPAELAVWRRISRYRPAFTRQLVVAPFIIDLVCRQVKLGVEFDGSQHIEAVEADERRSAFLRSEGWTIIRFWNSDVLIDPDGVTESILTKLAECLGDTHPLPLPSREGRKRTPRFN